MTKYVPTLTAGKEYNLKLVAVIDGKHNAYTYVDDDGDQMLVRNFDDPMRLPYTVATMSTRVNPKTGRTCTVVGEIKAGGKFPISDTSIPESWRTGNVLEGEELLEEIKNKIGDAIEAVEYADSEWESDCEEYARSKGGRAGQAFKDSWEARAIDEMDAACRPFAGINNKKGLMAILRQIQ